MLYLSLLRLIKFDKEILNLHGMIRNAAHK